MRATITDHETIESIRPLDLAAYLRVHGWARGESVAGGLAQLWNWTLEGNQTVDVVVPLERNVRDFSRRLAETLKTLEAIENRSQLEILADLQQVRADVVRWRWIEAGAADGTISLEQGQMFLAQVRTQLLAVACSTARPAQYFASRKPTQAVDYMKQVRLGQSERGSYVVNVHSPVPPLLEAEGFPEEVPFERQVSLKLLEALQTLRQQVIEAGAGGELANPSELARKGVSSNFCESVAEMLGRGDGGRMVEIQVGFAGARPEHVERPLRARLSADQTGFIQQIGRVLRESASRDGFELEGFVTNLNRDANAESGIATIQGLIDGQYRRVEVEVERAEYENVVLVAHRERQMVECVGELERMPGRGYRLRHARDWFLRQAVD